MPHLLVSNLETLEVRPHPLARDEVIASTKILQGSNIISVPTFTSVLLPAEKARRCDNCHRIPFKGTSLQRCTGCASFWYCDVQCQTAQWKAHHKRICKIYNQFVSSLEYQALAPHEKMDSLLLSSLVVQISQRDLIPSSDPRSPISIFLSLLPGPVPHPDVPPICVEVPPAQVDLIKSIYARFGNNNFAIHSHLTTFGHGIFPLASRLFNHSCTPNAVAKYIISQGNMLMMEIVALRDILPHEEICLSYLDPALIQSRKQVFEITYGFACRCSSCLFLQAIGPLPEPPTDLEALNSLTTQLRQFVHAADYPGPPMPSPSLYRLPNSLYGILHESFLGTLSEIFSKSSHEGRYREALDTGNSILAYYTLIYPQNFPQIGMHLLELAKTQWNEVASKPDIHEEEENLLKEKARSFLNLARRILMVLGPEGDEYGPLHEIQVLRALLNQ